jgi:hypothetical protein
LKDLYLTREQLNARKIAPTIAHSQLQWPPPSLRYIGY